ncbi:MAG: hypothetical protein AB1458_16810, partial [Bacteroidota bacterium]
MRHRTAYDSLVIFLYSTGKENLLPVEFRNAIPYSTKSTWRNIDFSKYRGSELRGSLDQPLEQAELYLKYRELKAVHRALTRMFVSVYPLLDPVKTALFQVKQHRELLVETILRFKNTLAIEKALKLFRLSRATFQRWMAETRASCDESFFHWCNKTYPMQLMRGEVNQIRQFLSDSAFSHWPVSSLAYYCSRENIVHASLGTWYKLRKLLGIERKRHRKIKKTKGIVSTASDQYWHMDVTRYTSDDNMLHYIYLLSDNYSKKILAWSVDPRLKME